MRPNELSEDEEKKAEDLSFQLHLDVYDFDLASRSSNGPNVLHYTNGDGLLGILSGDSVWLTHSSYLNDPAEQTYPVERAQQCLLERAQADAQSRFSRLLKSTAGSLSTMQSVFIASFCASNQLNQWRVYCPNGGYALEFSGGLNASTVPIEISRRRPLYRRIEYRAVAQVAEFHQTIESLREAWETNKPEYEATLGSDLYDRACSSYLQRQLQFLGHFHKAPFFEVEEEWRLALMSLGPHGLGFRHRSGVLIPHFDWSPSREGGKRLPLVKVWIGPRNDRELDVPAVQLLLQRYGYAASAAEADQMVAVAPFRVRG